MKPSEISTTQNRSKYLKSYLEFSYLCESIINEDSTIVSKLRNQTNGIELAQLLHKKMHLPHNVDLSKVNKVELGRPKPNPYSSRRKKTGGRWSIFIGTTDVAAVHYNFNTQTYTLIGPNIPDELAQDNANLPLPSKIFRSYQSDQWSEIKRILSSTIGKIKEIYQIEDPETTIDLKRKRESRKKNTSLASVNSDQTVDLDQTVDRLVNKFKSIFLRTLESAEAEYKGVLNIMLKANSYRDMSRYVEKLTKLEDAIDRIKSEGISSYFSLVTNYKKQLKNAIYLAAQYYYPELTRGLTKLSYGGGGFTAESQEGVKKIITDISQGDTKKLVAILGFFKNEIIRS